jgi:CO/xanthine dehydrogenase FAD-binding subunit
MDLVAVGSIRVPRTRAELAFAAGERALGGGTWLFSEPQPDVHDLVDLTRMPWPAIEHTPQTITVAATCTIAQLREQADSPLFAQCADSLLASWKVQHVATVGGNIALSLPAGPMTSLAVALDATLVLWAGDRERRVPAADFVTDVRANVLDTGEVIRSIEIPRGSLARTAFRRIALSPLGRTGALVIGRRDDDGRMVITVSGGTRRPRQLRFDGVPGASELADAVDAIDGWYDDAHGSPDWRHAMSARFAEQVREELSSDLDELDHREGLS